MTDAGKVMITPKGEYDASETYEKYDNVSYSGVLYIALKTVTGIEPTDDGTNWMKWIDLGSVDVNSLSPTFTEATDRVNVMSGETIPTLFGKIKKWFADLKKVAFSGSYNDLSDTPTIPAAVSVKGNNETAYRTGEVNLTAENIGAVATDGDTTENTVAFTSADSTTATAWTDVAVLSTGEKHSSIFNKVSTMFKNIRFLYKMLGTTDISAIGDGTVTNALSTLNSNLNILILDTHDDNAKTMEDILTNYANQNIKIYIGWFDWTDSRAYNNQTTLFFAFDWCIIGISALNGLVIYDIETKSWKPFQFRKYIYICPRLEHNILPIW